MGGGSYYDDEISLTLSGTTYTSGLVRPIGTKGEDAFLRMQGKLLENDSKFYIAGNIQTSGIIKIGIGSPPRQEYSLIDPGTVYQRYQDVSVMKTCYGRWLPTGSLLGE